MSLVTTQAEMPFRCLKTCARNRRDRSGRPRRERSSRPGAYQPISQRRGDRRHLRADHVDWEGYCRSVRLPLTLGAGDRT
jgi:hypothetical protein